MHWKFTAKEAGAAPWRKVIITESVFSIGWRCAPLKEIAGLADKYGARLFWMKRIPRVVLGRKGRGLAAKQELCANSGSGHTCGKALDVPAPSFVVQP